MNDQNLIPNSERSPSELREQTRRGGIASGEARRRKRTMREIAEYLLTMKMCNKNGDPITSPITGKDMDIAEAVVTAVLKAATTGNMRAVETVLNLTGENVDRKEIDVKTNGNMTFDEFKQQLADIIDRKNKK